VQGAGELVTKLDRQLEERLVRYVRIDTQSDEGSPTSPSTEKQLVLLRLLADELEEIGASDITLTDYGTVLASIPATVSHPVPTIAFLGHVDTVPGFSGTNVEPVVHRDYDGADIAFANDPDAVLSPKDYSYLASKVGDDIVTGSGVTLLGADDKAGVAIVMEMVRQLLENPEIPHGPIRVCFTPDEEIGRGVHPNLPKDLRADVAYTLDGAELGEIVFETFSGDKAVVKIRGVSTHPGDAKDNMVNALRLAAKACHKIRGRRKRPMSATDSYIRTTFVETRQRRKFTSSCGTSRKTSFASTAPCWLQFALTSNPRNRGLPFPARFRHSIETCATGCRTTCGQWSSRKKRVACLGSRPFRRRFVAVPMAPGSQKWVFPRPTCLQECRTSTVHSSG
jgi:hypothetical protein